METDIQTTPGRLTPCCGGLKWALSCGYIKKGFSWWRGKEQTWVPWTLNISGEGYKDTSPISFCPFCGKCLDVPEDS